MEPTILYEDDALIAVNKPAGMIVYPDERHDYPALSHWLAERYAEFHFVHRIDRETSGILIVAKTEAAHAALKEQFEQREVRKHYRAFVYGGMKEERGTINKPIGSARGGLGPRSAMRPYGTTREAITTWSLRAQGAGAAYVDVFPKTGRTHQIRVHFSAIQHPVIGDPLYAHSRPPLLGFERLALHALSITFAHPNGKELRLEAPLPQDFIDAEAALTRD